MHSFFSNNSNKNLVDIILLAEILILSISRQGIWRESVQKTAAAWATDCSQPKGVPAPESTIFPQNHCLENTFHVLFKLSSRCNVRRWIPPMISLLTRWENTFLKLLHSVVKGTFLKNGALCSEKACSNICIKPNSMFRGKQIELQVQKTRWRASNVDIQ